MVLAPAAFVPLHSCIRRRPCLHVFLLVCALMLTFRLFLVTDVASSFKFVKPSPSGWIPKGGEARPRINVTAHDHHPISRLIHDANLRLQALLEKRSFSIEEAASRYRERRGRHPPPGFDAWFAQAVENDAIVVEEFFDRIHHDINPFWAVSAKDMRMQANTQPQVIRVRSGEAEFVTDDASRQPWIQLWTGLVQEMMPHLPDLDMAVNIMDEPRVLVPWEKMNTYLEEELAKRELIDAKRATSTYSGLKDVDEATRDHAYNPGWITDDAHNFWDHLRIACPPGTAGRNVSALASLDGPVEYPSKPLPYMYHGFIGNFTQAQDACLQPHLRGMHGTFIESISMSTSHDLFPIFGGSKLLQNNELLIPGAMYLSERELYNGGQAHGPAWPHKRNSFIWRGTASGGRNKEDNWWHFHRHRWVQMMNGTTVSAVEAGDMTRGPTFTLLPEDRYSVLAQRKGRLGEWLSSVSDVAFVNLECFPSTKEEVGTWPFKKTKTKLTCPYTSPLMGLQPSMPMKKQYGYKFLPDVDGNSFSGRWRAFLQSTSMPLKATIYTEWHDDRLVPWVHFVPFDSSYGDIYAIMAYFLDGHDQEAERIAMEGKRWADMVYRRADMKLYVWRLLLEYARVVDDERDRLAFVGDLQGINDG